jgi:DNA-binding CsgD family transcriptional regulator
MTLTQQSQPALYPGMNCNGIELFTVESKMKFIANGKVDEIINLPYGIRQLTKEQIKREPAVEQALLQMHPDSQLERENQFLQCRYGGLDFTADIKDNKFKDADYWDCPKRSTCPFNGIVCKAPSYNGIALNALEVNLMKLLSTNATNEVIAETLQLALGSFHKAKKALYKKLGNIQTKQETALIAKSLNLI